MNDREEWQDRVRDIRAGGTTWWWWHLRILYIYYFRFFAHCWMILCIPNTNIHTVSSNHFCLIIFICLHTVTRFQITNDNPSYTVKTSTALHTSNYRFMIPSVFYLIRIVVRGVWTHVVVSRSLSGKHKWKKVRTHIPPNISVEYSHTKYTWNSWTPHEKYLRVIMPTIHTSYAVKNSSTSIQIIPI